MHHWGRKLEELKKRVSSGLISSRKRKWSVLRAVNNKIEIRRDTLLYLSPYFAFFDNVILHLQCEIFLLSPGPRPGVRFRSGVSFFFYPSTQQSHQRTFLRRKEMGPAREQSYDPNAVLNPPHY